jgi:hypothetical protein
MRPDLFILLTIPDTVASQLIFKKGMFQMGIIPSSIWEWCPFFFNSLTNLYVIFSLLLAFIAALGWIAAVSKLDLSYAYPFISF